jgi:phytol kinase
MLFLIMHLFPRRRRHVFVLLLATTAAHRQENVEAFSSIRESSTIAGTRRRPGLPSSAMTSSVATIRSPSSRHAVPEGESDVDEVPSKISLGFVGGDSTPGDMQEASQNNEKPKINTVITALVASISSLTIAAKTGILRGPLDLRTGVFGIYTDDMIIRDVGSTMLSTVLAFVVVKLVTFGYEEGYYSSKISRKLSHTFLAPFFIIVYPIFSPADGARYFAAVVTLVNAIRLYLAATSEGESSLARSVSRSGDKAEALGGPFIYVCLLSVFILGFWRSSMTGIVAASTMAAGDGMADLVGRQWGRNNQWWFSDSKSIVGTVAFAVSASLTSYGLVNWLQYTGCLQIALNPTDLALRIVAISIICSIVELLPIGDDNFTVPLSAATLAALLLQ